VLNTFNCSNRKRNFFSRASSIFSLTSRGKPQNILLKELNVFFLALGELPTT